MTFSAPHFFNVLSGQLEDRVHQLGAESFAKAWVLVGVLIEERIHFGMHEKAGARANVSPQLVRIHACVVLPDLLPSRLAMPIGDFQCNLSQASI